MADHTERAIAEFVDAERADRRVGAAIRGLEVAARVTYDSALDAYRHGVGAKPWLEPRDGGTLVRESWDISQESPITKPVKCCSRPSASTCTPLA